MYNNNYDWLNELKVGDEVIVHTRWMYSIGKVEAVNKATIKVNGTLYNKSNGYIRGRDTWNFNCLEPVTDEKKAAIKLAFAQVALTKRLQKINTENLTAEQVEAFNTFLNELTK